MKPTRAKTRMLKTRENESRLDRLGSGEALNHARSCFRGGGGREGRGRGEREGTAIPSTVNLAPDLDGTVEVKRLTVDDINFFNCSPLLIKCNWRCKSWK